MKPVILICGVPGSGKTWVAKQLPKDQFDYVPHDDYPVANYAKALRMRAEISDRTVVGEAPFRVTELVDELQSKGIEVTQFWVIEDEKTTTKRYETREKKPILKQHLSNRKRYDERTKGTRNRGTSDEVLKLILETAKHE